MNNILYCIILIVFREHQNQIDLNYFLIIDIFTIDTYFVNVLLKLIVHMI